MQKFPKQFQQEIERAARRQQAAARHFFIMDTDDLITWSRWMEERRIGETERTMREKSKV